MNDTESTAMIYSSVEEDNLGVIQSVNLACASMFGYNKTELVNRKINILMP